MRTKRILKAFCLSAALLSMGLTASRAMAACNLFANSLLCYGGIGGAGSFVGPVSGSGTDAICTANTATNPCVTSAGITTLNFANGQSSTVGFTGIVASSTGCAAIGQNEPNTAQFCATTPLTAGSGGVPVSFLATDDNKQCTAKGKPLKCCTGAGAGSCGGNVCVVPDSDFSSCPSGENCLQLSKFNAAKDICPATDFGCEFASNVVAAGVGLYTYGNGPNGKADPNLTGCTQWVQFTANNAISNFAYEPIGPLMGSCGLHGTSMVLRCQGNLQ